ncbi:MAG: hypothetical protein ACYST6_02770 [Planctomycetota bacterium]|jgi:hypothetical protein
MQIDHAHSRRYCAEMPVRPDFIMRLHGADVTVAKLCRQQHWAHKGLLEINFEKSKKFFSQRPSFGVYIYDQEKPRSVRRVIECYGN